ncbi:hypothetical protein GCM10010112_12140 [Actinoplanes lobatus]|uniref:histidine kinase n=1 Tax=Actinoplanes lobatus TaxID=113568 RepID=A0A7W7HDS9_9ACTN|nr:ATP-binding protein [Actinoplanes lobatus]MBB4748677.1 signal transduction histidine kinase/CHASE3 domain sensor protein [Actinoplanes lobatus]GGN58377.1 hypothetical protein GCM10010112_12140 [Actinoplanes lobatus]GIE37420.1 hypothetical protein Alo02nite_03180 [Actinoplanes lobatus]
MNPRPPPPEAGSTSIGQLLRRAFGWVVALVFLMGVAGLVATVPPFLAISTPLNDLLRTRSTSGVVRTLLFDGQQGLDGYLLTGQETDRASYLTARQDYPAAEAALRAVTIDSTRTLVETLATEAARWWALADQQIDSMPRAQPSSAEIAREREQFARVESAYRALDLRLVQQISEINRINNVLNAVALAMLAVTTALAGGFALRIGNAATRRITSPLAQVLEAVARLGRGEREVRVTLAGAPTEIEAVAAAVNTAAGEGDRERRTFDAFQEHSAAVRHHLSRGEAVAAAAQVLGDLLGADHVVIRLAPDPDGEFEPEIWSAAEATGDPTPLAGTPVDWDASQPGKAVVRDVQQAPPGPMTAALHAAAARRVIEVTFGEGGTATGQLTVVREPGRGTWRPYEVHLAGVFAADLARILTHAKLFEQAHELVARTREVDATKTELLWTVSHELRTPLTSVAGYLEVLIDREAGPLNAAQERMLGVIDQNVVRLRRLIEDLLMVSRIEAGRLSLSHHLLDLGALVRTACTEIKPAAHKAELTVTCDVDGSMTIRGDREHLDRMLLQLLANAVKFTRPGGTVTVAARISGPNAVLVVRDTGIGIPAPDMPHLFTRFFRATNAIRQAIPGTGLGLTIVSTVVEQHGGTVTIDSEEGAGTTATIVLPIAGPADDDATSAHRTDMHEYSSA